MPAAVLSDAEEEPAVVPLEAMLPSSDESAAASGEGWEGGKKERERERT